MRRHVPITVAPNDEFDMYGLDLPLDNWAYVLDEPGSSTAPGWYPFHRPLSRSEQNPTAPLLNRAVPIGKTEPTGVRISPNAANYSWRNEYVRLVPFDHRVRARMALFVRKQGLGAMVRRITVEVDLRAGLVMIPEGCPDPGLRQSRISAA